jgi:mitotic spindle assembly checkpoint protein MAD2
VVIAGVDTKEVLERWVFDIQTDKPGTGKCVALLSSVSPNSIDRPVEKPQKEIMLEIQAIIRQITASVTFLPLLNEPCTFDLLVYTNADAVVPQAWEESDPKYITKKSQEVRLRSFTTKVRTTVLM